MDILEFTDKFFTIEKEHRLFEKTDSEGLYYWDIVRHDVFYEVYNIISGRPPLPSRRIPFIKRLKILIGRIQFIIKNEILLFYRTTFNKYKYLFFVCSRYRNNQNQPVDYISKNIMDVLNENSLIIETDSAAIKSSANNLYCNFYSIFKRRLYRKTQKRYEVSSLLNSYFKLSLDIDGLIFQLIKAYRLEYDFYKKLFDKIEPKAIFLIPSEIQKSIFTAANELNIPTLEIQHGLISYEHPAYSYRKDISYDHLKTMPTYFLTFSDFWSDKMYFPAKEVISIGNDFFYSEPSSGIRKAIIVIFSEINEYLAKLTEDIASRFSDIPIYAKLHLHQTSDIGYFKERFKKYSNTIVVQNEKTMKELFEVSHSLITIESTTVYEALQAGLKIFICKKDDYYTHKDIFDNKNVYLIDNTDDIVNNIDNKFDYTHSRVFFDKFDKNRIEKLVEKF